MRHPSWRGDGRFVFRDHIHAGPMLRLLKAASKHGDTGYKPLASLYVTGMSLDVSHRLALLTVVSFKALADLASVRRKPCA